MGNISRTKRSKKNKRLIGLSITLIILSILAVAFALLWSYRPFSGGGDIVDQPSDIAIPDSMKGRYANILVAGISDNDVGGDPDQKLTDMIMLVCVDLEQNKAEVLQIPRDTYVGEAAGSTGKINAVYKRNGESINSLITTIGEQFRLPVTHYVTFTLEGFREGVDALGGIPINLPEDVIDTREKGGALYAGEQVLNGEHAEWFVRFRHGYSDADIGRLKAQRIFLAAAFDRVKSAGLTTLATKVFPTIQDDVTSDMAVSDMMAYVNFVLGFSMDNIRIHMAPGEGVSHKDAANPTKKYDVYTLHKEATAELLNTYFRPYSEPVPAEELGVNELKNTGSYNENTQDTLDDIAGGEKPGQQKNEQ